MVEDGQNEKVFEFPAPFTDNTTLVASLTLSLPDMRPSGLAFDAKGDLFVSNEVLNGTVSEFLPGSTVASVTSRAKRSASA